MTSNERDVEIDEKTVTLTFTSARNIFFHCEVDTSVIRSEWAALSDEDRSLIIEDCVWNNVIEVSDDSED